MLMLGRGTRILETKDRFESLETEMSDKVVEVGKWESLDLEEGRTGEKSEEKEAKPTAAAAIRGR